MSLKATRFSVGAYQKQVKGCPENPQTIGEHIKKRRIELGLKQTEVATLLGAHRGSIQLWERGEGEQGVKSLPPIIRFLGYVPFGHDGSPGGQLSFLRHCCGKTQEELAVTVGCNPSSLRRWENNLIGGSRKYSSAVAVTWAELERLEIEIIVRARFG